MAQPQQLNGDVNVKAYDPLWEIIRSEAHESMRIEPLMASFLFANVLSHDTLRDAVTHRVAQRLGSDDIAPALVRQIFSGVLEAEPSLPEAFRADLAAVYERDPACQRHIDPLLYFKGFHALQTHRFAHWLHNNGRRDFALYLQSQSSRVFGVDIHPAAKIGRGLMFDHATGIVIGETATIGDNTSLLHGVTLGGSGKETGDRHPKIGFGVMVGAGAKVLGNIEVGEDARIAAGSVVLEDVGARCTVAGVPARPVGGPCCEGVKPAELMNQRLEGE